MSGDNRDIEQIDRICDAFEQEWIAGRTPDVAEWLQNADVAIRERVLRELLSVDVEYRQKAGAHDDQLREHIRRYGLNARDIDSRLPDAQETIDDCGTTPQAKTHDFGAVMPQGIENFELIEEIGRGGMGIVYKARQLRPERIVAFKTLLPALADPHIRARFKAEANAVARLEHPGIVSTYEVGETNGLPWFTMAFVEGQTLSQLTAEAPEKRLKGRHAADIVRQIADAVHFAHERGVIHRDIKPSNVLVDATGVVRVVDFGLAKIVTGSELSLNADLTGSQDILGTVTYMSPEQAAGKAAKVGPESDVYSIGAVLYRCITGRPPFSIQCTVETLRQVVEDTPPDVRLLNPSADADLETICMKCLEKPVGARFRSAAELSAELGRYLNGESIHSRRSSLGERAARWCRRRPYAAASIALSILLMLVMMIGVPLALLQHEKRQQAEALAAANAARAATQEYYAKVSDVRELRRNNRPGWTWDALDLLQDVTALPADGKDPVVLRTLTASVLTSLDLKAVATFAEDFNNEDIALSDDGRLVAIAESFGYLSPRIRIFELFDDSGKTNPTLRHELRMNRARKSLFSALATAISNEVNGFDSFSSHCFSHDGKRLAAGTKYGQVQEWELTNPSKIHIIRAAQTNGSNEDEKLDDLVYSPDDRSLIGILHRSRNVVVWSTDKGQEIRRHKAGAGDLDDLGDGRIVLTTGRGIALLDPANDFSLEIHPKSHHRCKKIKAFSPDCVIVFGGSDEIETLSFIEPQNGSVMKWAGDIKSRPVVFRQPKFGPGGATLLGCRGGSKIGYWDAISQASKMEFAVADQGGPQILINADHGLAVITRSLNAELHQMRCPFPLVASDDAVPPQMEPVIRTFAPAGWPILAFDLNEAGDKIVLLEGKTRKARRVSTFDLRTGERHAQAAIVDQTGDLHEIYRARGADVIFGPRGNVVIASTLPGFPITCDDQHGFLAAHGLTTDVAEADPEVIDGSVIRYRLPVPKITKAHRCLNVMVSCRISHKLLHSDAPISAQLSWGAVRETRHIDSLLCRPAAGQWTLMSLFFPLANADDSSELTCDFDLKSLGIATTDKTDFFSADSAIQFGRAFLATGRTTHHYTVGPLATQANDTLMAIDDGQHLRRWSDLSKEPEFSWSDQLNHDPTLTCLTANKSVTIIGTRKGHVYRMINDTVEQINHGPDTVEESDDTPKRISAASVSSDGRLAAAGNLNGEILLFDLTKTVNFETVRQAAHSDRLSQLAMTPDGTILASSDNGRELKFWDCTGGQLRLLFELDGLDNPIIDMKFTPDGNQLFTLGSNERGIRIFDLKVLRKHFYEFGIDW